MNNSILYIVSTPIGNLGDISLRALEVLKTADLILCEDTRVTKKLLFHYNIVTQTMSYHEHSDEKKSQDILKILSSNKNIALVTDAGTPGISDPGGKLVEYIYQHNPNIVITSIPGPSALISALSVCGFSIEKFTFLGFPPHKNKRNKFFDTVGESEHLVVLYESNHRINKTLISLNNVLDKKQKLCVCRELTKKFETIYRGTISEILDMHIEEKGEFVIIINKKLL